MEDTIRIMVIKVRDTVRSILKNHYVDGSTSFGLMDSEKELTEIMNLLPPERPDTPPTPQDTSGK